jgi:hypothetical protein
LIKISPECGFIWYSFNTRISSPSRSSSCTRHVRGITQHYRRTWAHKRGYNLELYSLTEVQKFSTAISKTLDDHYIGRNM